MTPLLIYSTFFFLRKQRFDYYDPINYNPSTAILNDQPAFCINLGHVLNRYDLLVLVNKWGALEKILAFQSLVCRDWSLADGQL